MIRPPQAPPSPRPTLVWPPSTVRAQPPAPAREPGHRRPRTLWPWAIPAAALVVVTAMAVGRADDPATPSAPPGAGPAANLAPGPGPGAAPPSVYQGNGYGVLTLDRPPGQQILRFECQTCTGSTQLRADNSDTPLVESVGPYSGRRWIEAGASRLTVRAAGEWTLTVGGVDLATPTDGPASGTGDAVLLLRGRSTRAEVTNRGRNRFLVHQLHRGDTTPTTLVDRIGSYAGTVPLAGPALVQITSSGDWTLTPQ
ncbi:hypothetical protein F0L68_22055 [Solihabitans fulvus]|uniref:Uncharacterized protein n=1 Tax=Solihabitans fulvus TaxID=1892852 RepID=A0A5B2X5R8_9PSEU|nr:hypothetical protein [Solihabitans fulvus]KAA2258546.1 hypothetical protein F0L68_22055 [Solihabitans fulvus]